ncbi:MAG: hypothetical protein JNJ61_05840 [Anaerolineae bacterium]|nr:hypothetical protein [Anaerolineae bacterium]
MSEIKPEVTEILNSCVDAIRSGEKTFAECLREYPQHAAELRWLLTVALALEQTTPAPALSTAAVNKLEGKLRAAGRPRRAAQRWMGMQRLAATLALLFVLFLGSAGLVAASSSSRPGDTLYGIKRLWETIVLAFSPMTGSLGELWLQIARARLGEAQAVAAENRLSQDALNDLYSAMASAIQNNPTNPNGAMTVYMAEVQTAMQTLVPEADALRPLADVIRSAAVPQYDVNGNLLPLPADTLALPVVTATPTLPPSATPLPSATLTATPSPTVTVSPTLLPSTTPSETPRIPPTPTRTPSPTPSATLTPSPTSTPSATWTPLPLPGTLQFEPAATRIPDVRPPTDVPISPLTFTPNVRERETQQSVYLTQTAGPPQTTPTPSG